MSPWPASLASVRGGNPTADLSRAELALDRLAGMADVTGEFLKGLTFRDKPAKALQLSPPNSLDATRFHICIRVAGDLIALRNPWGDMTADESLVRDDSGLMQTVLDRIDSAFPNGAESTTAQICDAAIWARSVLFGPEPALFHCPGTRVRRLSPGAPFVEPTFRPLAQVARIVGRQMADGAHSDIATGEQQIALLSAHERLDLAERTRALDSRSRASILRWVREGMTGHTRVQLMRVTRHGDLATIAQVDRETGSEMYLLAVADLSSAHEAPATRTHDR